MIKLTEQEFQKLNNYLRKIFGINMSNKQYLVESRLSLRLSKMGFANFSAYWDKLITDKTGAMVSDLIDCLTTNYTFFYREEKHFQYFAEEATKRKGLLNIWCAGCSTGQESYTLAMQLEEYCKLGKITDNFCILATDISQEALKTAQTGIYQKSDCEKLPLCWQNKYLLKITDDRLIVVTEIRDHVRFLRRNLMDSPPFMHNYDFVFCRNVLIYFKDKERQQVIHHLFNALKPGGFLFIGHTESLLGYESGFKYVKPSVYQKAKEI